MAQQELTQQKVSTREQIELILPGINKVWVRSRKGGWCLKGSEDQPVSSTFEDHHDIQSSPKKWWKFW